MRQPSKHFGAK